MRQLSKVTIIGQSEPQISYLTNEISGIMEHFRTEMDRRRAHEAVLDRRMYAIHGAESVLENPVHFSPQFEGLRKVFKQILLVAR